MSTTPTFAPRDNQLMRKYLVGGAAIGGGTALVTSLLNYLGTLKDESNETEPDNDTLYLNLRKKRPAVKMASLGAKTACGE